MGNNFIGIIISFLFVIFIILISSLFTKAKIFDNESSRKFIHIGVSNCWIILMIFFDNIWLACIPPIAFILINYISYKYDLLKAMERKEKNSFGTVYFPISILILVLITFWLDMKYVGAVGILILGYGDGLAGLIGKKYGKNKIYKSKTAEGSIVMFIASLLVSLIILSIFTPTIALSGSIIIAIIATAIELFTPRDLDNLSVPLGASITYYGLILFGSANTNILLFSIILNLVIAVVAYKKKALDFSGSFIAVIMGIVIFMTAGPISWLMLMLFFASSSLITQFKKTYKSRLSSEYRKTRRNYKQVLENGLIPMILSIVFFTTKSDAVLLTTIATIAINCADTWSSEIGVLNKGKTISIITLKQIKKGESGGISLLGTVVSLLGAAFIAISFILLKAIFSNESASFISTGLIGITLVGFIGCMVDSLLGATIQAESVSNGMVNLLSNIIGGLIGFVFFLIFI